MCEMTSARHLLIEVHLLLVYSLQKLIELTRVIFKVNQLRAAPLTPSSRVEIGALIIF